MRREDIGILVGMCYGDGYLNVRKNKRGFWKSDLVIVHSIKQLEYLTWKHERLIKIFGGKNTIAMFDQFLPRTDKVYRMCRVSKSNSYFRRLKHAIYKNGVKKFTRNTLNLLTPEGIAVWYMDDGHAGRNYNRDDKVSSVYSTISTYCSEKEARIICDYFIEKWGIEFRVGYDMTKRSNPEHSHIIRVNTHMTRRFVKLIKPYILPSMQYKISHVDDIFKHERQIPEILNIKEPYIIKKRQLRLGKEIV